MSIYVRPSAASGCSPTKPSYRSQLLQEKSTILIPCSRSSLVACNSIVWQKHRFAPGIRRCKPGKERVFWIPTHYKALKDIMHCSISKSIDRANRCVGSCIALRTHNRPFGYSKIEEIMTLWALNKFTCSIHFKIDWNDQCYAQTLSFVYRLRTEARLAIEKVMHTGPTYAIVFYCWSRTWSILQVFWPLNWFGIISYTYIKLESRSVHLCVCASYPKIL